MILKTSIGTGVGVLFVEMKNNYWYCSQFIKIR